MLPKAALIEAKRDRRKKNEKRTNASAVKSTGNLDAAAESKSPATGSNTNSDQDTVVTDPKTASEITTASASAENPVSDAAATNGSATKTELSDEVGAAGGNAAQTVISDGTEKADKPKKRFGRPYWTWKRRRNTDKSKDKTGDKNDSKAGGAEDKTAAVAIDSKEETTVTTEDTTTVGTTQVASAA